MSFWIENQELTKHIERIEMLPKLAAAAGKPGKNGSE